MNDCLCCSSAFLDDINSRIKLGHSPSSISTWLLTKGEQISEFEIEDHKEHIERAEPLPPSPVVLEDPETMPLMELIGRIVRNHYVAVLKAQEIGKSSLSDAQAAGLLTKVLGDKEQADPRKLENSPLGQILESYISEIEE